MSSEYRDRMSREWSATCAGKDDKLCVNGCGKPVAPPSEVICKACQDKITKKLQEWAER